MFLIDHRFPNLAMIKLSLFAITSYRTKMHIIKDVETEGNYIISTALTFKVKMSQTRRQHEWYFGKEIFYFLFC